jgi:hypothetical protein
MRYCVIVLLGLFIFQSMSGARVQTVEGATVTQNEKIMYGLPTLVLFGDDSREEHTVPLKRIAVIDMRDMNALWDALGIDTSDWLPTDPYGMDKGDVQNFPMLYAALGYIMFERAYQSEQLEELIVECRRGKELVGGLTEQHTAETLLKAAVLQREHGGSLLLRAGICDPSDPETCPK